MLAFIVNQQTHSEEVLSRKTLFKGKDKVMRPSSKGTHSGWLLFEVTHATSCVSLQ